MVYFSREGYRDLALLLFPAMLATAALLLSRRPYIFYATFVVGTAAILIFLQVHGLSRFARHSGNYFDLLNVSIILTLISFSLGLLSNAMRRSVADYRALVEQAGEGVIVLDNRRLIRVCNSAEHLSILSPGGAGAAHKVSFELTVKQLPESGDAADGAPCGERRHDRADGQGPAVAGSRRVLPACSAGR
jgi:hypothetical protein